MRQTRNIPDVYTRLAIATLNDGKVHQARDTNEDLMLGDFNHGSMSKPASFSVRQ